MDGLDGEVVDVDVRFRDGQCHCDVTVDEGEDEPRLTTKHYSRDVCLHCPGVSFRAFDCIPRFLRHEQGSFYIRTFAPDAATVADLVEALRSKCQRVRLVRLTDVEGEEGLFRQVLEVDATALTPTQRRTLERAVEMGYYDPNREITQAELADDLGISTSALSQRLRRAEATVMRQLLDG